MKTIQHALIVCILASAALLAAGCGTTAPEGSQGSGSAPAVGSTSPRPSESATPTHLAPSPPKPTVEGTGSAAAVPPSASPRRRVMRGHGIVKSIDPNKRGVSIEHEANSSTREKAGVSHYPVADPRVLSDVNVGDEVDYDVERDARGHLVISDVVQMGR